MNAKKYFKDAKSDFYTYAGVIAAFIVISILKANGGLNRSQTGLLVPICCYIVMAVSLNLTVGILGDLSLGHAGFMSVGAFSGITVAMSLASVIPSAPFRLALAMVVGAILAGFVGFLIGIPVLRLTGDYLAIVTLAFGEIIKELITCLLVGVDSRACTSSSTSTAARPPMTSIWTRRGASSKAPRVRQAPRPSRASRRASSSS